MASAETGQAAPCPQTLIDFADALADAARVITAAAFRSRLEVIDKADQSPVTRADREAEARLRDMIAGSYPDHGIVGEEHGAERADADYVWVLDPIDGTKRFITGNPLFGTLIALLHKGAPLLGVIDMGALGERWVGARGHATVFGNCEGRRPVSARACAGIGAAALCATSPDMFEGAEAQAFDRLSRAVKMPLYGGDCYSYGLLASGFVDLVVESSMAPYDYLAHVPIIAGAGGTVTDWEGRALGLDSGPRVVAAGDPALHEAALALLQHG